MSGPETLDVKVDTSAETGQEEQEFSSDDQVFTGIEEIDTGVRHGIEEVFMNIDTHRSGDSYELPCCD